MQTFLDNYFFILLKLPLGFPAYSPVGDSAFSITEKTSNPKLLPSYLPTYLCVLILVDVNKLCILS